MNAEAQAKGQDRHHVLDYWATTGWISSQGSKAYDGGDKLSRQHRPEAIAAVDQLGKLFPGQDLRGRRHPCRPAPAPVGLHQPQVGFLRPGAPIGTIKGR